MANIILVEYMQDAQNSRKRKENYNMMPLIYGTQPHQKKYPKKNCRASLTEAEIYLIPPHIPPPQFQKNPSTKLPHLIPMQQPRPPKQKTSSSSADTTKAAAQVKTAALFLLYTPEPYIKTIIHM